MWLKGFSQHIVSSPPLRDMGDMFMYDRYEGVFIIDRL